MRDALESLAAWKRAGCPNDEEGRRRRALREAVGARRERGGG